MFGPTLNSNQVTRGKYPVHDRTFTDVIFCILFVCFWIFSMCGIIYGFSNGNLENIGQPYDDSGNRCGEDGQKEFERLFFVAPTSLNLKNRTTVCVKECPADNTTKVQCYPNLNITSCDTVVAYPTVRFIDFCVPYSKDAMNEISDKLKGLNLENISKDIQNAWASFLVAAAVAFLISAAYCYLLEYCAGIVVTVLIFLLLGALSVFGWLLSTKYNSLENQDEASQENSSYYYWGSIICWTLAGLLALMVCCLWSRIMLAITIIQAAADFITDYQRLLLVPLINVVIMFIYISFWIYSGAYLFSVGDSVWEKGSVYGRIKWTTTTRMFWYTHIVALFWNIAFILYLSHFVICVVAIMWYFATKRDELEDPLWTGYKWGLFYHVGSLAFGSLILAIIWVVQLILAYLQQQAEEVKGADNKVMQCFLRVASCLVSCFERFIKYLSKHAFIEVAMKSVNFFRGAGTSMSLIMSNSLRLGVLHGLCSIVISFGVFGITACTLVVGFCLLEYVSYFSDNLYSIQFPLLIIGLIGFVVAKLFGHIFDISADTIIHCYLTEEAETGTASSATNLISNVITTAKEKNEGLLSKSPVPGMHVGEGVGLKDRMNYEGYK